MPAQDRDPSEPMKQRPFNRRDFVATAIGSSFAASVLPVGAQTIVTDAAGLVAGPVTIDVGGFKMAAYRAAPAGRSGLPVVLVVSEVFGVHAHIADVVRRFARQGYLAVAPELFARQGNAQAYTEVSKLIAEVVSKKPDAETLADLDATLAWTGANGGSADKVAVTGFCWGGRIAWLYAAHSPAVRTGVAWYGRLQGLPTPLAPRHPVDLAREVRAPVLGLYGAADQGIPLEDVENMKAELAKGGEAARKSQFVVYPDAPHAFHADYRPSYRPEAAADAWKRCLSWLAAHGVGSTPV